MERAGFVPRLGAFLVDLGIFTFAVHLFTLVDILLNQLTPLNNFGLVSLFGSSVLLIMYGVAEALTGRTPGKALCGLVIVSEEGTPATRRALWKRWAVKHSPVFFAAPTVALWAMLSPYNYHFPLHDYVALGVMALAIVDTVVTSVLLLLMIGGCLLVLKNGQALHDMLGGTSVYRASEVYAPRAFSAAVAREKTNAGE